MADITAGKTGSITTISSDGLTLTVSGTVETGDVGRVIMLTNNASHPGRYRLISAVDADASTYTISNPFGTSVFRNLPSTASNTTNNATNELDVAVNDTYVISRTWSEEAAVNADLELVANTQDYFRTTGVITFLPNCLLYDEEITLEMDYQDHYRYDTDNSIKSSGMIFGRQNFGINDTDTETGGYPSNSCTFIDTSAGFISGTYDDPTVFHMNGGYWRGTEESGSGTFYRYNDGQDQSFRFWSVNIVGKFGGRIAGDYSVFYDNFSSRNTSTLGVLNPLTMAVFQDNTVSGSTQAVYSFPNISASSTTLATTIQDITTRIIRTNGGSSSNLNTTTTIVNWDFDSIDEITDNGADLIVTDDNNNSRNTTYDWRKDYEITVTDSAGNAMTQLGEVIFEDTEGTQITDSDDSAGNFPAQRLKAYDYTESRNGSTSVASLDTFASYTPYNWAVKYRGHQLITGNTSLRSPPGPIQVTRPALVDNNVTDTISNIDDYTEIETADELYDYADKFKHENIELPTITTQLFTKEGTTVVATDSEFDITFDPSATDIMSYVRTLGIQTLTQDTSGAFAAGHFGLRGDSDINTNAPIASFSDWSAWLNQWIVIRLDDVNDSLTFMEEAVTNGLTVTRSSGNDAVFTMANAQTINTDYATAQVTAVGATNGAPAALEADWTLDADIDAMKDITIKSASSGYTGGLSGFRNVSMDTEILGEVSATNIFFPSDISDGDVLINTSEAVSGTLSITSGTGTTPTYEIRDADVSDLTITRSDGDTDILINLVNTTGSPDVSDANVSLAISLTWTINDGPEAADQIIALYDSDVSLTTPFFTAHATSFDESGLTHPEIVVDNVITYVWSAPGYNDVRGNITLTAGVNTIDALTPVSQGLPADPGDSVTFDLAYNADSDRITVDVSGANTTNAENTNYLVNQIKIDTEYANAVAESGITDIVRSQGSTGNAEVERANIVFTPGENATQKFGYIQLLGSGTESIKLDVTVSATIDGTTQDVTFIMDIPDSPAAFDVTSIDNVMNSQLDGRYLTKETVGNVGLGVPAYDGENLVTTVTT